MCNERPVQSVKFADVALERLRCTLQDDTASSLDLAVLVRQVLLGEEHRRGGGLKPRLPIWRGLQVHSSSAGLVVENGYIRAEAWAPTWLDTNGRDPASCAAASLRRRFGPDDLGPPADPFMARLGRDRYRSVGQRAAIRSALLTPPGATLAIDLPTGEGKSLVFQAIDEVGFASGPSEAGEGVTLVIVPTVALAYDHENACRKSEDDRLAYVGDLNDEDRSSIRARIGREHRGLVFAAPEAACRSLRPALLEAARAGRLKAIVVDEAHLVDAWGTGFRTDFQSLSGLRTELISEAPSGQAPRTILLSATLTPETLETLTVLFSDPGEMRVLSAGQLRPEPDYWVAKVAAQSERKARVVEALFHLPRPAILYVTEVAEAKAWGAELSGLGFNRMATFHGQTRDDVRKRTLEQWRTGDLDLVVATSAFGLGIDYPHVRSVVHACVPETFDRFYQEVGRGGRDGCSSISLMLPSYRDFDIARRLNQETVLSVERGLERWTAMFEHPDRVHLGGTEFRFRLDVAPGNSTDDIDLVGERSLQWNARLLTLLARAGLIRLGGGSDRNKDKDAVSDDEDDRPDGVFETVEILETDHRNELVWNMRVEPVRQKVALARQRNLGLMHQHLEGQRCPAELLTELYSRASLDPICSECAVCREDLNARKPSALRREPAPPWTAPTVKGPFETLADAGDVVLTYNLADSLAVRRRWTTAFKALWRAGFRSLEIVGDPPDLFERALQGLQEWPVFVSRTDGTKPPRLPNGPLVVIVAPGSAVRLSPSVAPASMRLLIVPENMQDVERPGEAALERFSGLIFGLDGLLARLI